jgi:hypothetical protein
MAISKQGVRTVRFDPCRAPFTGEPLEGKGHGPDSLCWNFFPSEPVWGVLDSIQPLPVGLDRQESPIPIGANGVEDKTVDAPAPCGPAATPAAPSAADTGCKASEVPESVLEEALRITDGARCRDYGSAKTNHQRIALFWKVWDICKLGSENVIDQALGVLRVEFENLPTDDSESGVAMKMILLKLARHANTPKRDNLVDMAGYARCESRIQGMEQ